MQIEIYNVYNPKAKKAINPNECIKEAFSRTEQILKYLLEIKPEIKDDYLDALKKRVVDEVRDYRVDSKCFDLDEIRKELTVLQGYSDLEELVLQFTSKYLALPENYQFRQKKYDVQQLNEEKAYSILPYHKLKAIIEVLGKEEGIRVWKQVMFRLVDERLKNSNIKKRSRLETKKLVVKRWSETEYVDFTLAVFDEHKVLYRFDRCTVHEAMKHLNDPDIAYLATCYWGEIEGFHPNLNSRMRRTQTLHHGDFCDEFCWDSDIHTDPKQPSLEFTRKLGKSMNFEGETN